MHSSIAYVFDPASRTLATDKCLIFLQHNLVNLVGGAAIDCLGCSAVKQCPLLAMSGSDQAGLNINEPRSKEACGDEGGGTHFDNE